MKELKRLNIKPYYCSYPPPKSGHRNMYIRYRVGNQKSYSVCLYEGKYGSKSFRNKSDALCWKFIIMLIHKSKTSKNPYL